MQTAANENVNFRTMEHLFYYNDEIARMGKDVREKMKSLTCTN
jgi:predicted RNA-binding Zn ribbon-like protein